MHVFHVQSFNRLHCPNTLEHASEINQSLSQPVPINPLSLNSFSRHDTDWCACDKQVIYIDLHDSAAVAHVYFGIVNIDDINNNNCKAI